MPRKRSGSPLKLGSVTFGEREPHLAFADALSPYFAKVEISPQQAKEQPRKRIVTERKKPECR